MLQGRQVLGIGFGIERSKQTTNVIPTVMEVTRLEETVNSLRGKLFDPMGKHLSPGGRQKMGDSLERFRSIFCSARIPLWVKLVYTLFVVIFLCRFRGGGSNLLWICHVAVLTTLVAVWLENSLLVSMQALAIFWPHVIWQLDFLVQLATGTKIFWVGFTDYMFDANLGVLRRAEYLHHVWLLYFLLWMLWRLGYHRRALLAQTLYACVILMLSYTLSTPAENPNWIHGFWMDAPQTRMEPWLWVALLMGFFPACWYLPLHFGLCKIFPQPKAAVPSATEIMAKQPALEPEGSTGG